jgi:hypothetical protein
MQNSKKARDCAAFPVAPSVSLLYAEPISVPDPHVPDPLVNSMDPDPSIIFLSSSKNSKKNLDSYCFVTSFGLFIFEK